jgi:hypothetical protein
MAVQQKCRNNIDLAKHPRTGQPTMLMNTLRRELV